MVPVSYRSSNKEVRESFVGGSAGKPGRCFASVTAPIEDSPWRKTMFQSLKAQISGWQAATQRVEDNAFHLGYFA